jgi:hypothetical protein
LLLDAADPPPYLNFVMTDSLTFQFNYLKNSLIIPSFGPKEVLPTHERRETVLLFKTLALPGCRTVAAHGRVTAVGMALESRITFQVMFGGYGNPAPCSAPVMRYY